jgi:hypothetical protein
MQAAGGCIQSKEDQQISIIENGESTTNRWDEIGQDGQKKNRNQSSGSKPDTRSIGQRTEPMAARKSYQRVNNETDGETHAT